MNQVKSVMIEPVFNNNQQENDDCIIYNFEFLSTWGSSNEVSCSSIWFLDAGRRRTKPIAIKSEEISDQRLLSLLYDASLIKSDSQKTFCYQFSKNGTCHALISFYFRPEDEPAYCRIWNTPDGNDTSLKDFKIFIGNNEIVRKEVPINFGIEVSLDNAIRLSRQMKQKISQDYLLALKPTLKDDFGTFPMMQFNRISLTFHSNHGSKSLFGINGLEIFDESHNRIKDEDISFWKVKNTISHTNLRNIFQPNEKTGSYSDPFVMEVGNLDEYPKLVLNLNYPRVIGLIRIYNAKISGYNHIGIEKCTIKLGNSLKIHKKFAKSDTVDVWLTDSMEYREKIESSF